MRGDGPKDGAPRRRARGVQEGGAHRALTRPWPGAARGGSRDLSLAPPGARRRLAPLHARGPCASAAQAAGAALRLPGWRAQPPRGAAGPAALPLLRSGPTDRRERPQQPRCLAPRPPSAVRPNQGQPGGGYQGDAAPRPAGGVAEGPPRALFAAKFKGRQGGSPASSPKLGRGGANLERTATPSMQRAGTGRRGPNWGCRACWYLQSLCRAQGRGWEGSEGLASVIIEHTFGSYLLKIMKTIKEANTCNKVLYLIFTHNPVSQVLSSPPFHQ